MNRSLQEIKDYIRDKGIITDEASICRLAKHLYATEKVIFLDYKIRLTLKEKHIQRKNKAK